MTFFQYLQKPNRYAWSFGSLRSIKWRAEQILQKPDEVMVDIDRAAIKIRSSIDEHNQRREKEEFEKHVEDLLYRGGWELRYLENFDEERGPTYSEIRDLLENWPHWADDKPTFTHAEDFDDLESLQDIWLSYQPYNDIFDFGDLSESRCYAVLALMRLEDAAEILHDTEEAIGETPPTYATRPPLPTHVAVSIGNLLIEAMEIICYAERTAAEIRSEAWRAEAENKKEHAQQELKDLERKAESERARALANIRWSEDAEKRENARTLVRRYWDLWSNDRALYKNQGEFARDMEEKIEMEIGLTAKSKPLYSANTIEVKLIPKMRNT